MAKLAGQFKGKRTYILAGIIILTSISTALADPEIIAQNPHWVGFAGAVVGAAIIILRSYTDTPPGQSGR